MMLPINLQYIYTYTQCPVSQKMVAISQERLCEYIQIGMVYSAFGTVFILNMKHGGCHSVLRTDEGWYSLVRPSIISVRYVRI